MKQSCSQSRNLKGRKMAIFNTAAKLALKPAPQFISPKAHALMDYISVGSFLAGAAWFWSRNKRAALAAAICGGTQLALSLLTDYSGRGHKAISFRAHGEIDLGLATMSAAMPESFAFEDDNEKKFFLAQGALITAVRELTDFHQGHRLERKLRIHRVA
jgi:hypothetical protein